MKLARLISMNAFTRLASRSVEEVNINVAVTANFTKPNRIIAALKLQTVIRPFWTSAQEDSLKGRPSDARHYGCFSLTKRRLNTIVRAVLSRFRKAASRARSAYSGYAASPRLSWRTGTRTSPQIS